MFTGLLEAKMWVLKTNKSFNTPGLLLIIRVQFSSLIEGIIIADAPALLITSVIFSGLADNNSKLSML